MHVVVKKGHFKMVKWFLEERSRRLGLRLHILARDLACFV
jgi:hypothetical protein